MNAPETDPARQAEDKAQHQQAVEDLAKAMTDLPKQNVANADATQARAEQALTDLRKQLEGQPTACGTLEKAAQKQSEVTKASEQASKAGDQRAPQLHQQKDQQREMARQLEQLEAPAAPEVKEAAKQTALQAADALDRAANEEKQFPVAQKAPARSQEALKDLRTILTRKSAVRPQEAIFAWLCRGAAWSSLAILCVLLGTVIWKAVGWFDWQFLTSFDSQRPERAGIWAGLIGSSWMILLTFLMAIPVGVGAAVYLEEYARDTGLVRFIRVNLSNLAGVPSIVYGILGLTVFVRMFDIFSQHGFIAKSTGYIVEAIVIAGIEIPLPFGETLIAGAMTMALLILPVIIVSTQEALRAIPPSIRHASLALGATKWQTVRHQVLPAAVPGILTGIILSISRAIGETAPLIVVGAVGFARFAPGGIASFSDLKSHPSGLLQAPFDRYTVMPMQIFNWVGQALTEFQSVTAAGILVLLGLLLALNGVAIYVRNRYQRKLRW